uniref:Uncharacterized protein n=1 Tax=Leersia perrieri TaxID=77586 RepID=A0A0D9XQI7_9ORYZ
MGSKTDVNKENIMILDFGELSEADRQEFESHVEDLRRKMLSCYRKTRKGVTKQDEFTLPVNGKSKSFDPSA